MHDDVHVVGDVERVGEAGENSSPSPSPSPSPTWESGEDSEVNVSAGIGSDVGIWGDWCDNSCSVSGAWKGSDSGGCSTTEGEINSWGGWRPSPKLDACTDEGIGGGSKAAIWSRSSLRNGNRASNSLYASVSPAK